MLITLWHCHLHNIQYEQVHRETWCLCHISAKFSWESKKKWQSSFKLSCPMEESWIGVWATTWVHAINKQQNKYISMYIHTSISWSCEGKGCHVEMTNPECSSASDKTYALYPMEEGKLHVLYTIISYITAYILMDALFSFVNHLLPALIYFRLIPRVSVMKLIDSDCSQLLRAMSDSLLASLNCWPLGHWLYLIESNLISVKNMIIK